MIGKRSIPLFRSKLTILVCILFIYAEIPVFAFNLTAVGDVNFGGRVASYTKKYGYGYPYQKVGKLLQPADLTFGNLECALSARGKPVPNKKYTFCGSPENARFLKEAGFDVLSVANNHSKDFGDRAFIDTLDHLKRSGIVSFGGDRDLSKAFQYQIVNVKGAKIAFLAVSDILPPGFAATLSTPGIASARAEKRIYSLLKDAKTKADFVVVSIHWGKEMQIHPTARQTGLAHEMIRQGADLILGHHPHVVQGVEIYRRRVIAYSLGNFIFSPGSPKGRQSVILNVNVNKKRITDVRLYPVYIDDIRPRIIVGKQGQTWLNEVSRRSGGLKTLFKVEQSKDYPYLRALNVN